MNPCNPSDHKDHLCHLYSENLHQKEPQQYARLVKEPHYVCKSCGRVAAAEKNLCEPTPLGTWEE